MEAIKNGEFHSLKFGRKSTNFIELKCLSKIIFFNSLNWIHLVKESHPFLPQSSYMEMAAAMEALSDSAFSPLRFCEGM